MRSRGWLRWRSARDLDEEIAAHVDLETQANVERGMPHDQARVEALRKFGNRTVVKENVDEADPFFALRMLGRDARLGVRNLCRTPRFTIPVVAILALGIGANTAVSVIANATLRKGFRLVEGNDRVLYIHSERNGRYSGVSYPDFADWRNEAKSFSGIGAVADLKFTLADESDAPQRYTASRITANGFQLLGVKPAIGRDFVRADEAPGALPVAILSHGFWMRRFGGEPSVLGRTLRISGGPQTTIVGVMPDGFSFPQYQDLWLPLVPDAGMLRRDDRGIWFAFGRLSVGASVESVRAELDAIGRRLEDAYPLTNRGQVPRPHSFPEFFVGPNASAIYASAWGAVSLVLLIACLNVGNLMLARTAGRSGEMFIRAALGAGRTHIVRLVLTECLLLSLAGGLLGWWVAKIAVSVYAAATNPPAGEWRRDLFDYSMDHRSLAYVALVSIGGGLVFSLAPVIRCSLRDVRAGIDRLGRGGSDESGPPLSRLLLIGETALAAVLLAGAGLMARSFANLYTAGVGARISGVHTVLLHLPEARQNREPLSSLVQRLRGRLQLIPGVEHVSLGNPPAGGIPPGVPFELWARAGQLAAEELPTVVRQTIGPDYFKTFGVTLGDGREFSDLDGPSADPVAVVSRQFASRNWPDENAVGQRFRLVVGTGSASWLTVVGVAPDIIYDPSRQRVAPVVYIPYAQSEEQPDPWVQIRSDSRVNELSAVLRHEIAATDPAIAVWLGPYNLEDRLNAAGGLYGDVRNHAAMFLAFGVIALLLAALGTYAVVANDMNRRAREISIRVALGARWDEILRLSARLGILPVAVGLAIGLAASLLLNPLLTAELVAVPPADPRTFASVFVVLLSSAAVACWIPGRRALRSDPASLLKGE